MTKRNTLILVFGIVLCALCALYPPRRINNTSSMQFARSGDGKVRPLDITRAVLFSPEFGIGRIRGDSAIFPAEVDGGSLLAELVLIGSLTGLLILIPRLYSSDGRAP
jgi:hypothetical protein